MKNSMRYFLGILFGISIEYIYRVKESTWAVIIVLAVLIWAIINVLCDNIKDSSDFLKS